MRSSLMHDKVTDNVIYLPRIMVNVAEAVKRATIDGTATIVDNDHQSSEGSCVSADSHRTAVDSACTRLFLSTNIPLSIHSYVLLTPFSIVVSSVGILVSMRPHVRSYRSVRS